MKFTLPHIILFLLGLITIQVQGQESKHFLFNSDNGLPTNEVYSAHEDENGLLYIAHNLGVSVYDGIEMKPLQIKGIKEGTSCYGIYQIKGVLWFKFADQLYYKKNQEILPYQHNDVLKESNLGVIYHFTFINEDLHFSLSNKSYKISKKGIIERIKLKNNSLYIDRKNENILRESKSPNDSILAIEYDDMPFRTYDLTSLRTHFGIETNRSNIYWNNKTIYYFRNDSIRNLKIEEISSNPDNWIISISRFENKLYVSTKGKGLITFDYINNEWKKNTILLPNQYTGVISIGKSGLWVPILDKGLAFFPNEKIKNFNFKAKVKNIYVEEDTLYIALLKKLYDSPIIKIDRDLNVITDNSFDLTKWYYRQSNKMIQKLNLSISEKNKNLPEELIPSIAGIIDPISKRLIFPSTSRNSVLTPTHFIQSYDFYILSENQNNLKTDTLWISGVHAFERISDTKYTFGGDFGIGFINLVNDKLLIEKIDSTIGKISKIQISRNGDLILSKEDRIIQYDFLKKRVKKTIYKTKDQLIKSSYLHKHFLFVGTPYYLVVLDTISGKYIHFSKSSGLSNVNITKIVANDSILAIANELGVSTIPMDFIRQQLLKSRINFNDFLKFQIRSNSLNLDFDYYELNPWSKISMQYSLNNSEFIDFSNQKIQLTNLQSGDYTMRVRFRISNGNWTELDPIYFKIPSPFYTSWWFSASIVLFISLIFILIIKRRAKIQTKKLETEKLIETLRMNALTSQMNPHFLYNALNTIQGLLDKDTRKVFMYVSDLARFFRLMLNNSSDIYIPIRKEIELNQVFTEIEAVRQFHSVDLNIEYERKELENYIIPSMILQPFIENALWHAFPKEIEEPKIDILISDHDKESIKITINDNGIGINNTKSRKKIHQSKGVSIVKNRLELFNADNIKLANNIILSDRSEIENGSTGTVVEIFLTKQNEYEVQSDHN